MEMSASPGGPFIGLKAQSYYTFWHGIASPGQLAESAKEWGAEAVALTDRGLMTGVPEFIGRCREIGIRPVVGCEFEGTGSGRLVVLARTLDGYRNLLALSTLASSGLPMGFEVLEGRTAGLFAVVRPSRLGTLAGLMKLRELFEPGTLRLELPWWSADEYYQMVLERSRSDVDLVATADFCLTENSDAPLATLVRRAGGRKSGDTSPTRGERLPSHGEMAPSGVIPREVWERACASAREVWMACGELSLEVDTRGIGITGDTRHTGITGVGTRTVLPSFPGPGGLEDPSYLRQVATEGARQRGLRGDEAWARLDREIQLVTARGLSGYFLILWDLVRFCRREGIPVGPGRGSAVGSLLAYCLGITEVNPLEHGLFFERFLNVERENLPDIDLDLGHRRRNEAVQYLKRNHGPDRVVHQGVITRLGARGAVRAAGRGLGTDPAIVDRVSKLLPLTRGKGGLADSLRSLPESRGLPLQDQRIGSLIKAATLLEGLPTGYATHGSALIISPRPVLEDLPLTLGAGGQFITQYGPEAVSALGFPKFDLLGLRNLTLIQDTLVAAGGEGTPAGTEGTPARPCETLDEKIPADDAKTWEMIGRGETIGCFQLDSPGMREVLRVTRPGSLGELSAALSLYRPGPWDPETLGAYVRRKEGKEPIPDIHPLADPALRGTYGVLLYQEQMLELARAVAGFSFGEADRFRRELAARGAQRWRQVFIERACARGVGIQIAERVFGLLRRFSGYSFNKAHVTAYALISYRTAFLKAHYPEKYFPLLVESDSGYFSSDVYRLEARRAGVGVGVTQGSVAASGGVRQLTIFDQMGQDKAEPESFAVESLKAGSLEGESLEPERLEADSREAEHLGPERKDSTGVCSDLPRDPGLVMVAGPVASCRRQQDCRGRPMLELLIRQGEELIPVSVPPAIYARDVLELDPTGIVVQASRRSQVGEPVRMVARQIRALAR